jgi:hypothetical protein
MAPSTLKSPWWNGVARQEIDPHPPMHGLRDAFGNRGPGNGTRDGTAP